MEENWDDDSTPMQQPSYQSCEQHQSRNQNSYRGKNNQRRNDNNRQRSRGRRDRDSSRDSKEQCTFFVETAKLGKLIGRGGSQIRELQEQSGAKINVSYYFSIYLFHLLYNLFGNIKSFNFR